MLKDIRADRATVANFRRRDDRELLVDGRMVVREDFFGHRFLKHLKNIYDGFLCSYWSVLKRTVL
jgi:hypothetical protein